MSSIKWVYYTLRITYCKVILKKYWKRVQGYSIYWVVNCVYRPIYPTQSENWDCSQPGAFRPRFTWKLSSGFDLGHMEVCIRHWKGRVWFLLKLLVKVISYLNCGLYGWLANEVEAKSGTQFYVFFKYAAMFSLNVNQVFNLWRADNGIPKI